MPEDGGAETGSVDGGPQTKSPAVAGLCATQPSRGHKALSTDLDDVPTRRDSDWNGVQGRRPEGKAVLTNAQHMLEDPWPVLVPCERPDRPNFNALGTACWRAGQLDCGRTARRLRGQLQHRQHMFAVRGDPIRRLVEPIPVLVGHLGLLSSVNDRGEERVGHDLGHA